MRIGELSRRTKVSVRMLRYYEEQGLLSAARAPNGYREFGEDDVARVVLVASLVRSGLPTRLITPLLRARAGRAPDGDLAPLFAAELERLESRISCLTISRDAVADHLTRLGPTPAVHGRHHLPGRVGAADAVHQEPDRQGAAVRATSRPGSPPPRRPSGPPEPPARP